MAIEDDILLHIADTSNPHRITKEQIGLGHIENNPVATNAEAEAGTLVNRYVTPANLKSIFDGVLKRAGRMDASGNIIIKTN